MIAKKAVELDIVPGRSPISVAAAAIYMASQVKFLMCIYSDLYAVIYVKVQDPSQLS